MRIPANPRFTPDLKGDREHPRPTDSSPADHRYALHWTFSSLR